MQQYLEKLGSEVKWISYAFKDILDYQAALQMMVSKVQIIT